MKPLRSGAALLVAICVVALSGIMLGRAVAGARRELAEAEAYQEEGQLLSAIEHHRRALRWSFPLSPFRERAVAGLESIARELEESDDRVGALLAWRSLLGGISASRFVYSRKDADAERAKDEIARLLALEGRAAIDASLDSEKLAAVHRHLLAEEVSPQPFGATLLLVGFALWLGSLVLLINRGFTAAGRFLWPAARTPLSSALAGLVSFVVGLLLA